MVTFPVRPPQGHLGDINHRDCCSESSLQIAEPGKAAWFMGLGQCRMVRWDLLDARPGTGCSAGCSEGNDDGPQVSLDGAFLTAAQRPGFQIP